MSLVRLRNLWWKAGWMGAGLLLGASGCISLHRTEGRAALDQFRYQDALDHYGQILQKKPSDTEALRAQADAYFMINRHDSARARWQQLESAQALPAASILPYAQSLMALGEYNAALTLLDRSAFSGDSVRNARADAFRASCIRVLSTAVPQWEVEIREVEVPGLMACGGIDFFKDGFVLTGQTARTALNPDDPYTGLSHANLYLGKKGSDPYRFQVTPWSDLNSPYHDGYAAMDATGRRVAWSRNNTGTGKSLQVNAEQTSTIQIYFAISDSSGSWSRPIPFPFNEEDFNFAHPTWLPSGEGILFASDFNGTGAQGGMDLWYTLRNGDFWSEPVNLGPAINTPGDELFPFLHRHDSLFFSSDGHPTLGGLDLQLSVRAPGLDALPHIGWSPPVALPTPLNSPADDFGLRLDDGMPGSGYLASDRGGMDRLYRFGLSQIPMATPALVSDSMALAAVPSLESPIDGEVVSMFTLDSIPPLVEDPTGHPTEHATALETPISSPPSAQLFATEYYPTSQPAEAISSLEPTEQIDRPFEDSPQSVHVDSTLSATSHSVSPELIPSPSPIEEVDEVNALLGTAISWPKDFILPEIYWDLDKAYVRKNDEHPLEELAQLLISNPDFHLEIHSHCDSRGTFEYNVALAQRRADAVKKQLLELGVPDSQMHSIGFGESKLRNGCSDGVRCTEAEHQYNRRTEFRLVAPPLP